MSIAAITCLYGPGAGCLFSQDEDFFGGNAGVANTPVAENDALQSERALRTAIFNEKDPVVKSLLIDPPTTPQQLGKAVKLMVRINRLDEVGRWLRSIEKLQLDETTAIALVDSAGPRTFGIIAETESIEISPAGKELAKKIIELASGARMNPAALTQYADQMRSLDTATRLAGYRGIESAGRAGVQAFLANVMASGAQLPTPIMCEALAKLDSPAWEAWSEAIRTTHSDARLNLAVLAYGSRDPKFLVQLASVIDASDPADESWTPLRKAWGGSSKSSEDLILKQAVEDLKSTLALHRRIRFDNDAAVSLQWRLAEDGRTLQLIEGRPADVVFQRLQSCASTVLRSAKSANRDSALAYAILGESLSTQQSYLELQDLIARFKDDQSFYCFALDVAVENDLGIAQAAILEEFKRFLVPLSSDVKERLVRSLDSGFRVVRYRSASVLMDYMFSLPEDLARTSLYGRNKLDRVAKELVAAKSKPVAFVVGSSSSLRSHTKALLDAQNYSVVEYGSATEVISDAKQGTAPDKIFIVSSVFEVSLAQLVQRLRAIPVTSRTPILMLCDRLNKSEIESIASDGRVVFGSVPPDAAGLLQLVSRLTVMDSQTPSLIFSDRLVWGEKAGRYLATFGPN
ncbi:MAG: hypothetical protein MUC83_10715 [Pirellula sp.]|nr:hypothetical protein [Pirellula sp.]